MKITVTSLTHTHRHGQTTTVHANDDAANDEIHRKVAASWDDLHCLEGLRCGVQGCTGVPNDITHLTRDEAIAAYRSHVKGESFDLEPHDLDVTVLLTDADNDALIEMLTALGDTGRDRLSIMMSVVSARQQSAAILAGVRETLNEEHHGREVIGVTFSTWDDPDDGLAIHPDGTVLFSDGITDTVMFSSSVAHTLNTLFDDVDDPDYTVTVDLRSGEVDGDDLNHRTIYDLFVVPELTVPADEALRQLRWALSDAESGEASPDEIATRFAKAFRALDTSMTVGAALPPQWQPRHLS